MIVVDRLLVMVSGIGAGHCATGVQLRLVAMNPGATTAVKALGRVGGFMSQRSDEQLGRVQRESP